MNRLFVFYKISFSICLVIAKSTKMFDFLIIDALLVFYLIVLEEADHFF